MTKSSTDSSLLERLRGPHRRSECGNFAEVHPDFLNELDIALTAAEAKVARMGEALKEIETYDIRIEYHGLATSPSVVEIGPMGQIARSALNCASNPTR